MATTEDTASAMNVATCPGPVGAAVGLLEPQTNVCLSRYATSRFRIRLRDATIRVMHRLLPLARAVGAGATRTAVRRAAVQQVRIDLCPRLF